MGKLEDQDGLEEDHIQEVLLKILLITLMEVVKVKSAGGRHPVSPKGQSAKGLKTRDNKRTDKFIVKRRNKRKDTK